jgi:hypothetical protein
VNKITVVVLQIYKFIDPPLKNKKANLIIIQLIEEETIKKEEGHLISQAAFVGFTQTKANFSKYIECFDSQVYSGTSRDRFVHC